MPAPRDTTLAATHDHEEHHHGSERTDGCEWEAVVDEAQHLSDCELARVFPVVLQLFFHSRSERQIQLHHQSGSKQLTPEILGKRLLRSAAAVRAEEMLDLDIGQATRALTTVH